MTLPPNDDPQFDQWLRESLADKTKVSTRDSAADVVAALLAARGERRYRRVFVSAYLLATIGVSFVVLAFSGVPGPVNLAVNLFALVAGGLVVRLSRRAASAGWQRNRS